MEFSIYLVMFICGVVITSIYFLLRRNEPANKTPVDMLRQEMLALSARVKIIENSKQSKVELVELTDAMKQIMKDHECMKKTLNEVMMNFNLEMMSLIVHRRKPKRIEKSGHA